MKNLPQQGRRIVWLVRMLTVLGLALVLLTTGLIGWTLARVRKERVKVTLEQNHLDDASQALRESAAASRLEIQTLLDETAAVPKQLFLAPHFNELVHTQLNSGPDAAVLISLKRLDAQASRLSEIGKQVVAWRTNYSVVWTDLHQQRTMGLVRNQITQLRGAVEALEGRHRLEDAKKYRRWRNATGEEAARLAETILVEQSGQQSRDAADFKGQLAEFARLVELLGGEEGFDNLSDLRDNKLTPALDRLSRSIGAFSTNTVGAEALTPESITKLRTVLFGKGALDDPAVHDGLFALRRDALQLRREREKLESELTDLFQGIEAANANFAQSTQVRTAELTQQMERSLSAGWWRLPQAMVLAEERERKLYKGDAASIEEVKKNYREFVQLCEDKERETGEPVQILAWF